MKKQKNIRFMGWMVLFLCALFNATAEPKISINSIKESFSPYETIEFTALVDGLDDVKIVRFWLSDGSNSTFIAADLELPYEVQLEGYASGNYQIWAKAKNSHNEAFISERVDFTVDETSLTDVALLTPSEGESFNSGESIFFSVDAYDPVGVKTVRFWLDDGETQKVYFTDKEPPYEWAAVGLPDGEYQSFVRVENSLGQKTDSESVRFKITEMIPSSVLITTPATGSEFLEGEKVVLRCDAYDADEIFGVRFWISDGIKSSMVSLDKEAPYKVALNDLLPGDYHIWAKSEDLYGNKKESAKVSIKVLPTDREVSLLENAIIVPDQGSMKVLILDPTVDWNSPKSILWEWDVKAGQGLPANEMSTYKKLWSNMSEAKRVHLNGKDYIAICASAKDGVALIDFESKNCVYWGNATGSPHSLALLPDGNLVVANAGSLNKVQLFNTEKNNQPATQAFSHAGIHGVVWDATNKILWAWGGNRMEAYSYNFNRSKPKLTSIGFYRTPDTWGDQIGGHDLSPMIGTSKLLFTWSGGLGTFDTDPDVKGDQKFHQLTSDGSHAKGVSYHPDSGEIIYVKPNSKKTGVNFRSDRVRSLSEDDRIKSDGILYRARWYRHNSFSFLSD